MTVLKRQRPNKKRLPLPRAASESSFWSGFYAAIAGQAVAKPASRQSFTTLDGGTRQDFVAGVPPRRCPVENRNSVWSHTHIPRACYRGGFCLPTFVF